MSDPAARALEAYIGAAVAHILRGGPEPTHQNGLLFLSSWQEAMPALVHLDPVLEPVDSRVFAVLWLWAKHEGKGATAFPSYPTLLSRCNVQSRATIARSLAILRITRWVTLCRRVRDESGRNRANIYALHEEPLALASTVYLDPSYMAFLQSARGHRHERVAAVAQAMIESLQTSIAAGEDVLSASSLSQADRRLEAIAAVSGQGEGSYFGLRQDALPRLNWRKNQAPRRARDPSGETCQKMNSGPVQKMHPSRVQNLNSDPVQKMNSAANSLIIDSVQNLNSAPCSSSSSFINKKATTTCSAEEDRSPSAQAQRPLIYPGSLSQNEQRLAEMYLKGVSPDLHQALLDELADKLSRQAKTSRPVHNAIGLLSWMCNEAKAGRPPLTSAHLQARERRDREHHVAEHLEAAKRRLTQMALGKASPP